MTSNQHHHQQKYFGNEFQKISKYELVPWQGKYINKITGYLQVKRTSKTTIIDIGCGGGYVSVEMAKKGCRVFACDITHQAISNLMNFKKIFKLNRLTGIECPAERIPLPSKSADIIVANAILEHIPDEKKAISEWKRLLKPKGLIFITVPIKLRYVWPFFWPINIIHDRRIGHLRRYDLDELKEKFKYQVVEVSYSGHLLKILLTLFSLVVKSVHTANLAEKVDQISENFSYGASNITVVLNK